MLCDRKLFPLLAAIGGSRVVLRLLPLKFDPSILSDHTLTGQSKNNYHLKEVQRSLSAQRSLKSAERHLQFVRHR